MPGIGLALNVSAARGAPLAELRPQLAELAAIGYTHAELPAKRLGVIIGGQLQPRRLAALRAALDGCPLRLTVHGSRVSTPRVGNLVDITTPAQRDSVAADLALTAAIGGEVLVHHSGLLRDPSADARALANGLAAERDALRALGDEAGRHGIRIAVENLDPVGPYIARRAYGLRLDRLAEQVQAVAHPQVGICLDVGHAFLAASYLEFDYLAAIRGVAPLVSHIHLSDNLGQVELEPNADFDESLATGDGDLHLLPGWGAIPLAEVFAIDFPQRPVVVLELRPHFTEHLDEALAAAEELVAAHRR